MNAGENEIVELAHLVSGAKRIVAFTGAGISTECGIPDFRSPGGLWTKYRPIEYSEFVGSPVARLEAWRRWLAVYAIVSGAVPGRGHRAIVELLRRNQLTFVITQNIDGLHQRSGIPPERVVELHGNGSYARCLACGHRHELTWARIHVEQDVAPQCTECGGIVKTATISFGQPMPEAIMAEAHGAAENCDLFLSIGSSLLVYPAATLPLLARRWGAKLVILNREPTPFDTEADLVVHRDIGETLSRIVF